MKLSVLFVDDDLNIISGLKRMMYPLKNELDLYFASGGKEAIESLAENKIEVVISDIRMPGIDGNQLLTYVKDNYPQIVRITLSGFADDNQAIRNTRIVHQSLSKPTTPEIIKHTIENAYKLRTRLNNDLLLKLVNGIEALPSLPEIYLRIEEQINSPNTSIEKLSEIISTDPIISAKILQLTNSAFFGLPFRISNIKQALNFLGIKIIQNLVLSIKLFRSIDNNSPHIKTYQEMWNHSNNVAFISRQIAQLKNLNKNEIEDTYIAGLLHDIGKLILLENVETLEIPDSTTIEEIEEHLLKNIHAEVGAYLLGIWGLPDCVVEAVAYHHSSSLFEDAKFTPAKIVYFANIISYQQKIIPSEINESNIDQIICEIEKNQMEN